MKGFRCIAGRARLNRFYSCIAPKLITVSLVPIQTRRFSSTMLITIVTGACVAVYMHDSLIHSDSSPPLSNAELTALLKDKLQPIRKRLRDKGKFTPILTVLVRNGVHEIQISSGDYMDANSLLNHWSRPLQGTLSYSSLTIFSGKLITAISEDKKSSLKVEIHPHNKIVTLFKDDGFTIQDVDCILEGYETALSKEENSSTTTSKTEPPSVWERLLEEEAPTDSMWPSSRNKDVGALKKSSGKSPIEQLTAMGVQVFDREANSQLSWDDLAGYSHVKEQIEDTIVHAITYPDVYDSVARQTRINFESNKPKAVLLEGPPGTGKTLTARILARRCDRPLVHLKLESIVSKWYGDSEKKISKIFDACEELEGSIIFIDEVDAVAGSRDNGSMHEATRRILSVLLQRLEGFQGRPKALLVCATNRKQDLDPALLSRFDINIRYDFPDHDTRVAIVRRYARQFDGHLNSLNAIADAANGLSCRDIKEACQIAERRWASQKVRELKAVEAAANSSSSPSTSPSRVQGSSGAEHSFQSVQGSSSSTTETAAESCAVGAPTLEQYLQAFADRRAATSVGGPKTFAA